MVYLSIYIYINNFGLLFFILIYRLRRENFDNFMIKSTSIEKKHTYTINLLYIYYICLTNIFTIYILHIYANDAA